MHGKIEEINVTLTVNQGFKKINYKLFKKCNTNTILAINKTNYKDIWYASDSSYTLSHVRHFCEQPKTERDKSTQAFMVSLAVAAGNIYHLLLGDPQPIMAVGIDSSGGYWGLSKGVKQYIDWSLCVKALDNGLSIYGYPLMNDSLSVNAGDTVLPIVKLTHILMASLFLNDVHFNEDNFGLTREGSQLIAIKVDPELSFYGSFTTDTHVLIKEKLAYYLLDDYHSTGLWSNLSTKAGQFKKSLLPLLHSDVAHKEKLKFLETLTHSADDILHILIQQIIANTPYLNQLKNDLIKATTLRIEYFQMAYDAIRQHPFKPLLTLNHSDELVIRDCEEEIPPDKTVFPTYCPQFFNAPEEIIEEIDVIDLYLNF